MAPAENAFSTRFSIGEWYGYQFDKLTDEERLRFAEIQSLKKADKPKLACPFRPGACTKAGGVCSLRLHMSIPTEDGITLSTPVQDESGAFRITCPERFKEADEIYRWVGETILDNGSPLQTSEVGFLQSLETFDSQSGHDVGKIDNILATIDEHSRLDWCALEIQAVYFSGPNMGLEFTALRNHQGAMLFPDKIRRPDYRSSGPKRLMPQLQIKVPTLRRWGKRWPSSSTGPGSTPWVPWTPSMTSPIAISPGSPSK